jgi:hypothetical protein
MEFEAMEPQSGEPQPVTASSYEFTTTQERLIADLAGKMRFVSYFLIVVGVLQIIPGLSRLVIAEGFGLVISGVVQLLIGIWTNRAASSFLQVAQTRGNDIDNLMEALKQLRRLYSLQYWLLIVALVIFGIVAAIGLIGALFGRGS